MVTPLLQIDLTADILSDIREAFEAKYMTECRDEELEKAVAHEFAEHGFRPLSRRVMHFANSPECDFGTNKTEVARRLRIERTRNNDGILHGDLRFSTYCQIIYGT